MKYSIQNGQIFYSLKNKAETKSQEYNRRCTLVFYILMACTASGARATAPRAPRKGELRVPKMDVTWPKNPDTWPSLKMLYFRNKVLSRITMP
jgi:hypothetical protein